MGQMIQLVYVSEATVPFTAEQLDQLATTSAHRNQGDDITGLLVHHRGHFFQMLEGPEEQVRATYARIQKDERHTDCVTLYEGTTPERAVASWYMRNVSLESASSCFDEETVTVLKQAVEDGIRDRVGAARAVRDFVRVVSSARAS